MADITVACIAKNEANRWFPACLEVWQRFASRIVVLDNGSADETAAIAKLAGAEVYDWPAAMEGGEWRARKRLWELAKNGSDWVLHLDADQIPASDPSLFMEGDSAVFRVFDLWGKDVYRSDLWWTGHKRHWWRAVRPAAYAGLPEEWNERGWHSGHLPCNLPVGDEVRMPDECSILHYAYATEADRAYQAAKYKRLEPYLSAREIFHASTIESVSPPLGRLWFEPEWSLL